MPGVMRVRRAHGDGTAIYNCNDMDLTLAPCFKHNVNNESHPVRLLKVSC